MIRVTPPRCRMSRRLAAVLLACLPVAGAAMDLTLPPGAERLGATGPVAGDLMIPTAAFDGSTVPAVIVEGQVSQSAWRIRDSAATTSELIAPLKQALLDAGYRLVFDCASDACGGFDFRFALAVIPEPDMHVDLGDFRYFAASRDTPQGRAHVMLLVSRSSLNAFVQISEVVPDAPLPVAGLTVSSSGALPKPPPAATPPVSSGDPVAVPALGDSLATTLEASGGVPLDDLVFATGSSELGPGDFASLSDLAAYLAANPDARVTIVGHTDATGAQEGNVVLSRQRAQSVVDRLARDYGVAAGRLSADGVGYLAPRASNLTDAGRAENRRVEAILTPTR
jgi:outer membrane protein OmpA-like peptidoglycan-associated protein